MSRIRSSSVVTLALALALCAAGAVLWAQEPGGEAPAMPEHCRQMMEHHEKMMARAGEMDRELEALVQQMNAAEGQAKVDATAAVVAELVEQRHEMRDGMMGMCHGMMTHGMAHMSEGGTMKCPMMEGAAGMHGGHGDAGEHGRHGGHGHAPAAGATGDDGDGSR